MSPSELIEILDLCQQSTSCHQRNAILLKEAFNNHPNDELINLFCACLQKTFDSPLAKKDAFVERIINFTISVFTCYKPKEDEDYHSNLLHLFEFMLTLSRQDKNENYRYWASVMLNKLFTEYQELSDELFEKIKESMMIRLKEPKFAIREQAVQVLHRMQDPQDLSEVIIKEFCLLMQSLNPKDRRICVEHVALTKDSFSHVFARALDVDHTVRLAVYKRLSTLPKFLQITQRRQLIYWGFEDPSKQLREFVCGRFLSDWLDCYQGNYLHLMKAVRFDSSEEDIYFTVQLVENMLKALFKAASIENLLEFVGVNEQKVIPYEELNWETCLYYRIVVQYLRKRRLEHFLNDVLPELGKFCDYMQGYMVYVRENDIADLEYNFILQQLLIVSAEYDSGDEFGDKRLKSLIYKLLQTEDFSVKTLEGFVANLARIVPDLCLFLCEVVSNIHHGEDVDFEETARKEMERQALISEQQSLIHSLREQEQLLVKCSKFSEAETIKREIEEKQLHIQEIKKAALEKELVKKTDAGTLLKCLKISEALLLSPTVERFNPPLETLKRELVMASMAHESCEVKARALTCYALCCITDENCAKYGIHMFAPLLLDSETESQILILSIKTVADCLTRFGVKVIEQEEETSSQDNEERTALLGGTSFTELIQAFISHLGHEDPDVQYYAVAAIGRLLYRGPFVSSALLSHLILKWSSPATDPRIKELAGYLLTNFPERDSYNSTFYTNSALFVIRALAYAPQKSPLADVNTDDVLNFLASFTSKGQIHADLAFKLTAVLLESPKKWKVNQYFSKLLTLLNIQEENREEFVAICDDLKDVINHSQTRRNITKFVTSLKKATKLEVIEE